MDGFKLSVDYIAYDKQKDIIHAKKNNKVFSLNLQDSDLFPQYPSQYYSNDSSYDHRLIITEKYTIEGSDTELRLWDRSSANTLLSLISMPHLNLRVPTLFNNKLIINFDFSNESLQRICLWFFSPLFFVYFQGY